MKRFVGHVVAAAAAALFLGCGGVSEEPNLPGDHSGVQAIGTSESDVIWSAADQQCTLRGLKVKSFEGMSIEEGCSRLERAAGDGTILSIRHPLPCYEVCCEEYCIVYPEGYGCIGPWCYCC